MLIIPGIMEPTTYLWAGFEEIFAFLVAAFVAFRILEYMAKKMGLTK
jgi:hypothetical protein